MLPESVVTWKWKPKPGYRSHFGAEAVNTLRRMFARHLQAPHRFICVTDDTTGLDPAVEALPLWEDFANLPSPHGDKNPSCYRRLRMFAPDAAQFFGHRFVSVDLDCVVTGDMGPVLDRPEAFVIWGDYTNPRTPYNGSMMMLTAGERSKVWTEFDPQTSPRLAKDAGFFGSDQGWISYCLGRNEARWTRADGVYSYRNHLRVARELPKDARIVFFHGAYDPWTHGMTTRHPWVGEHWQ